MNTRHGAVRASTAPCAWTAVPHRATRDVDFLGLGEATPERLVAVFRELAAADGGDDAVVFDPDSVRAEEIREDDRYGGMRVRMNADFGGARVRDGVRLAWFSGAQAFSATVERSSDGVSWVPRAQVSADATGYLRFFDNEVEPGAR